MTTSALPEPLPGIALDELRNRKLEATQRLLGATIAISDEDWQQPSSLPGWTRAHVASHIARNADGLRRLATNVLEGRNDPMYPQDRDEEIERGSERNALELQIDLDTSAGDLNDEFDKVSPQQWSETVELRGGLRIPLHQLVVARMFEVEMHHVDLAIGRTVDDIDDVTATWLLRWAAKRLEGSIDARLVPSDREPIDVGNSRLATVTGSPQAILGWMTGRRSSQPVSGADGITPPGI